MNKLLRIFAVFVFLLLISVSKIFAHESFHWMQRIEKDRMLVVFYNLDSHKSNLEQSFQVRFVQLSNGRPIPYEYADIVFSTSGGETHTIRKKTDKNYDASFSYTYPKIGKYIMDVKLFNDSKEIISEKFPILVGQGIIAEPGDILRNYWAEIILLSLILIGTGYYIGKNYDINKLLTKVKTYSKK